MPELYAKIHKQYIYVQNWSIHTKLSELFNPIFYQQNILNFMVQKMLYFAESNITVIGVDGKTFNGKTHFLYWEITS